MIVEGYSMDLYCDNDDEKCGESIQLGGINSASCRKQARRWGWVINDKERKCYCPQHAKIKDRSP